MGNFRGRDSRGGFGGGRPSFQKNNWGGDRDRGEKSFHKAVCADCGKTCDVPFKPSGGKPVFCDDCFAQKRGSGRDERGPRRDFGAGRSRDRSDFKSAPVDNEMKQTLVNISAKLDNLISLFEKNLIEEKSSSKTKESTVVAKTKKVVTKPETKVKTKKAVTKKAAK